MFGDLLTFQQSLIKYLALWLIKEEKAQAESMHIVCIQKEHRRKYLYLLEFTDRQTDTQRERDTQDKSSCACTECIFTFCPQIITYMQEQCLTSWERTVRLVALWVLLQTSTTSAQTSRRTTGSMVRITQYIQAVTLMYSNIHNNNQQKCASIRFGIEDKKPIPKHCKVRSINLDIDKVIVILAVHNNILELKSINEYEIADFQNQVNLSPQGYLTN